MPEFAVTAIGRDRPGIVAGITGALLELGGNLEDSQMSILGGHFAVMLLVSLPDDVDHDAVSSGLAPVAAELELEAVSVSPVGEGADPARPSHVLSVYGADHPGIVHAVASALAGLGVNITDLETKLVGTRKAPVYVMVVEVALGAASAAEVEAAIRAGAADPGLEVALRELGAEAL